MNFFFIAAMIRPPSLGANASLHDPSEVSIVMPLGAAVEFLGDGSAVSHFRFAVLNASVPCLF